MPGRDDKEIRCSFCGSAKEDTDFFIAGDGAYICQECVELCVHLIEQNRPSSARSRKQSRPAPPPAAQPHTSARKASPSEPLEEQIVLRPKEIKQLLDEYVIGQDAAKKALSVAVYNHYKRIWSNDDSDVELQKSNILLLGFLADSISGRRGCEQRSRAGDRQEGQAHLRQNTWQAGVSRCRLPRGYD